MLRTGSNTVQELYFLLRQIPGYDPKKAKMIVRDFVYSDMSFSKYIDPWYEQVKKNLPNPLCDTCPLGEKCEFLFINKNKH